MALPDLEKTVEPDLVHEYCQASAGLIKVMASLSTSATFQREFIYYTLALHKLGQPNFIGDYMKIKRFMKKLLGSSLMEPDMKGNICNRYLAKLIEQAMDDISSGRQFIQHTLVIFLMISKFVIILINQL